jgi:4-aminobutyrate aminotransferase-like enzyme
VSRTTEALRQLRSYESCNITWLEPDGSWPIVWERAQGVHVWDAQGKKFLDLTAAFGVAAAGHANRRVVRAGQQQMSRLLHAMGDVHPHALKAQLARELSRITFERWTRRTFKISSSRSKVRRDTGKTIFCNSGFEAVEAALKTALLATGKPGVIAFTGAYHGTGYGALNPTWREHFRRPFQSQLGGFARFVSFPSAAPPAIRSPSAEKDSLDRVAAEAERLLQREPIGAVLVEPVQGRGGIQVPPAEFLPLLRKLCRDHGAVFILDEIYTGFGRTGRWFACEHSGTIPDIICLGKALTGGFPLSACVGRADLMDAAWPVTTGEAIHTSTYLGHPVGCAMALAQIAEITRLKLVQRSERLGHWLLEALTKLETRKTRLETRCRGLGLMAGLELCSADEQPASAMVQAIIKTLLRRGFILLPEGEQGNVISFTPPLTITEHHLTGAIHALAEVL